MTRLTQAGEALQALQLVDAVPHPFDISSWLVIVGCDEKNHKRIKSLLVTR